MADAIPNLPHSIIFLFILLFFLYYKFVLKESVAVEVYFAN